jgi:hypothetical protein
MYYSNRKGENLLILEGDDIAFKKLLSDIVFNI